MTYILFTAGSSGFSVCGDTTSLDEAKRFYKAGDTNFYCNEIDFERMVLLSTKGNSND